MKDWLPGRGTFSPAKPGTQGAVSGPGYKPSLPVHHPTLPFLPDH